MKGSGRKRRIYKRKIQKNVGGIEYIRHHEIPQKN